MNTLVIGGWLMTIADGNPYWSIGQRLAGSDSSSSQSVRLRECEEDWVGQPARQKLTADDLLWADQVVCYSYGMASLIELWHKLVGPAWVKTYRRVVVLAGVPDWWYCQFYGSIWHLPEFVQSGRCFQVTALPVSCDLKNSGVVSAPVGTTPFVDSPERWVNYNCDGLQTGTNGQINHLTIAYNQWVLDAIVTILQGA